MRGCAREIAIARGNRSAIGTCGGIAASEDTFNGGRFQRRTPPVEQRLFSTTREKALKESLRRRNTALLGIVYSRFDCSLQSSSRAHPGSSHVQ
jgi:hypothetical protein